MLLQFFLRESIQTAATQMCDQSLISILPMILLPDFISSIAWLALNSDTTNNIEKNLYYANAILKIECWAAFFVINCIYMSQRNFFLVIVESLLNMFGFQYFADRLKHKLARMAVQNFRDTYILCVTSVLQRYTLEPWNNSSIISVTLSALGLFWGLFRLFTIIFVLKPDVEEPDVEEPDVEEDDDFYQ